MERSLWRTVGLGIFGAGLSLGCASSSAKDDTAGEGGSSGSRGDIVTFLAQTSLLVPWVRTFEPEAVGRFAMFCDATGFFELEFALPNERDLPDDFWSLSDPDGP
jgi:hypothetical protein